MQLFSYFCFPVIFVLLMFVLTVLLLVCVISLPPCFLSILLEYLCIIAIVNFGDPLPPTFVDPNSLHHLSDVTPIYRHEFLIPRSVCENTHLCSSLHKLLTPRREYMCGRIEREAGSQGKEKHNNNFVVRTPREDGERVTLYG